MEFEGVASIEAVRRDLEGAYFAQLRTNGRLTGPAEGAPVRLLFGQTGGSAEQRNHTVGQVLGARRAQRIVATATWRTAGPS
ncbi:hypothetical protein [Streptomyces afghaniensis]|uniref:hypothetical protein n=1 Tax=Streptomyces afghaniensis TaxID=66865 RepID=UPI0037877268